MSAASARRSARRSGMAVRRRRSGSMRLSRGVCSSVRNASSRGAGALFLLLRPASCAAVKAPSSRIRASAAAITAIVSASAWSFRSSASVLTTAIVRASSSVWTWVSRARSVMPAEDFSSSLRQRQARARSDWPSGCGGGAIRAPSAPVPVGARRRLLRRGAGRFAAWRFGGRSTRTARRACELRVRLRGGRRLRPVAGRRGRLRLLGRRAGLRLAVGSAAVGRRRGVVGAALDDESGQRQRPPGDGDRR